MIVELTNDKFLRHEYQEFDVPENAFSRTRYNDNLASAKA